MCWAAGLLRPKQSLVHAGKLAELELVDFCVPGPVCCSWLVVGSVPHDCHCRGLQDQPVTGVVVDTSLTY